MKFNISRDQILSPLQQIASVLEKRNTIPILANVMIQVEEEHIVLVGTDTEIQIVAKLELPPGSQSGSTTVPARKLLDICRLLPTAALINIEEHDEKLKLTSGRSKFSLSTLPAEHYPEFKETEIEYQFLINSGNSKKL